MGQSNMAGSSTPVLSGYATKDPKLLSLGLDGKWTYAKAPLAPTRGNGLSPGHVFARHYSMLHPEATVGIVLCAKGGRSLKELSKGGKDNKDGEPIYDQAMKRIKTAMEVGVVKGVLWHQGEADATDVGYPERLKSFVEELRKDLGDENVPFIAGELGRFATWTAAFNKNMPRIVSLIPRCGLASSEGLMDKGDKVHFSGFSAETLGCRYLLEYLRLADADKAPRFIEELDRIAAEMSKRDAGYATIINGSMDEGESAPMGWESVWAGKGTLVVAKDSSEFAKGPSSLRLESSGGHAEGCVSQSIRNATGKRFRISGMVRNDGFGKCAVAVGGQDSSWKSVFWTPVSDAVAAKEWTSFTGEISVPVKVINASVQLFVSGEGKAWLDEVVVAELGASVAPSAAPLRVRRAFCVRRTRIDKERLDD